MIEYSDIYYIDNVLVTLEKKTYTTKPDYAIHCEYKGARISGYMHNHFSEKPAVATFNCCGPLSDQRKIQHILSKVNMELEIKKASEQYVSCILYSNDNYRRTPIRHMFRGYYSANGGYKPRETDKHLYKLTLERKVYIDFECFEEDDDKCKTVEVNYVINNVETIEGDKELLLPEFKFERYKKEFFDYCESEFKKCKGPFHVRMQEVIRK